MANYSAKIETDCNKFGIEYFDTSLNFENQIQNAIKYLSNKNNV